MVLPDFTFQNPPRAFQEKCLKEYCLDKNLVWERTYLIRFIDVRKHIRNLFTGSHARLQDLLRRSGDWGHYNPSIKKSRIRNCSSTDSSLNAKQDLPKSDEEGDRAVSKWDNLQLIAQKTDNMVIVTNHKDRIEWVNDAFTDKIGYSLGEVLGRKPAEFLHGPKTDLTTIKNLLGKMKRRQSFSYQLYWYTRNRKAIWVDVHGQQVLDANRKFLNYFRIAKDISKQKRYVKKLIDSRNKIKKIASSLNEEIEKERARISRDLHDDLGQILSGLKMSLNVVGDSLSKQQLIEYLSEELDMAIKSVSKIATELRPGVLDALGLIASLEWLVNETEKKTGIECRFSSDSIREIFDENTSIVFFRICQEGLHNAVKHSRASRIDVHFTFESGVMELVIKDNGTGFSGKRKDPTSMGIIGMRERADLVGATLVIQDSRMGTYLRLNKKT